MSARSVASPQSSCRFGVAVGDATPPVGIYHRMWGAARHDRSTGVHRPLRTTAMSFAPLGDRGPGEAERLLVAIDQCILGNEELGRIVGSIVERTGLPPECVAISCSHTHAAGLLSLERSRLPGGEFIAPYLDDLARTCGELAARARGDAEPVRIAYGTGRCDLAAHRDYRDAERGGYVVGFDPDGEPDDTVLVARVENLGGAVRATIVNYACHPTTLAWDNTLISPDYPGAMRETVEAASGAPCVFLQGASGELGPREGFVGDVAVADRNGRQLGHAALATLAGTPPAGTRYEYAGVVESGTAIGTWRYARGDESAERQARSWSAWRGDIPLPYRTDLKPLPEVADELQRLERSEAAARAGGDAESAQRFRVLAERCRREFTRRKGLPAGELYPWQVSIWRIGDAVWLCAQGEAYSLLQTELRRRFPKTPIVVASLGFSWDVAYLPPASCYDEPRYQTQVAILAAGALERGIDELAGRLEQLLR
ncbi:MAG: hypothetical protein WD069_21530 [Planctomycetales bacterium]